jgi:hypothetical protein
MKEDILIIMVHGNNGVNKKDMDFHSKEDFRKRRICKRKSLKNSSNHKRRLK